MQRHHVTEADIRALSRSTSSALYEPYVIKAKVQNEFYNDEEKLKVQLMSVNPLDFKVSVFLNK